MIFSDITNIDTIRFLWKANPCCPSTYDPKAELKCEMKNCGVYTTKSELPMPPFKYAVNNNSCII